MKKNEMAIRAIIIDDEKANRINLILLLSEYCTDIEIIGQAANITDGYKQILEKNPQLVLLDIRMPGGNAFDLLDRFSTIPFEIIFITAFDEYAIRAFRIHALDYLLKPIKIAELRTSIQRARQQILSRKQNPELSNFINNQRLDEQDKRIALPGEDKTSFVAIRTIIRCEADSNYTTFYLADQQRLIVSKTLKEFEEILSPMGFLRVHQSHLVNLEHIRVYRKNDGGFLETSDGASVPISRSRRKIVLEILNNQ